MLLGFGFGVLGLGFWLLGFGFWVLGFGFLVLGFEFWRFFFDFVSWRCLVCVSFAATMIIDAAQANADIEISYLRFNRKSS